MLIAIALHLAAAQPATLPPRLGRAVYAATLATIRRVDPALAAALHDGDGPKPLTCSGLLGATSGAAGTQVVAGAPCSVRITGLSPAVSQALAASLLEEPPAAWELDDQPFQVTGATCDAQADPWTGSTTYEEVASRQLTAATPPPRTVRLEFASPTSFKSKEMNIPVPLPGLVFGSLAERWNAFSPISLSPELRRFGEELVAISAYRLHSQPVVQKNAALRIGGVGEVTYRVLGGDRYWLAVLHMLADYALYSGVGVQTATGMGQARARHG
jgi:CRISPR-associated endoribonuclease Cas6